MTVPHATISPPRDRLPAFLVPVIIGAALLLGVVLYSASPPFRIAVGLSLSTLASEDAACVAAGALIKANQIPAALAVAACTIGIWVGDFGLYLLGRLAGPQVQRFKWVSRRLPAERLDRLRNWLHGKGGTALLVVRFVPGLRLPTYLAAGAVGMSPLVFLWWTALAAVIWTPALVLISAFAGNAVVRFLHDKLGLSPFLAIPLFVLTAAVLLRLALLAATEIGRARIAARVSKLWRWEFWPMWAFYPPILLYIAYLALKHRSLAVIGTANPVMPFGGIVGESKHSILKALEGAGVAPTFLIASREPDARQSELRALVSQHGLTFPLILKPDVGERGAGVKLARTAHDAEAHLSSTGYPILAQRYHPGPLEAGIFYYRLPSEASGHIFSITDKHFPLLTCDGESTLEKLIYRHRRYRMQAKRFLSRHAGLADHVFPAGHEFPLAQAGNHCQGTCFRDGKHLATPELERAIDAIAKRASGFYFGRFDVRYADVNAFKRGEGFEVIELNGIASESTNIYDPTWSLWRAYRTLFAQLRLLFAIASESHRAGARKPTYREFWRTYRAYRHDPHASPMAD